MMLLLAYLAVVVAVAAPLCGHVGEAWPPGVWWRAWRGGNAEDCPACHGTNPPYPFICPGPDGGAS